MKKNNKGFVFIETIIVVSILTLTMVLLFASYSFIIRKFKERNTFDTTEIIYKTYYTKSIIDSLDKGTCSGTGVWCYIQNSIQSNDECIKMHEKYDSYVCEPKANSPLNQVYQSFEIEKFYYVNLHDIFSSELSKEQRDEWLYLFDATTIDYINSKGGAQDANLLIVKYKKTYNQTDGTYEVLHSSMEVK